MTSIDSYREVSKKKSKIKKNQTQPQNTGHRIIADWFQAHEGLKSNFSRVSATSERAKQFHSFLWPASNSYISPLNPLFLVECLNLDLLNVHPLWMVRDGLIPLLWFFKINPEPKHFNGKLLIHEDLAPYVPQPWRKHTGQYSIENIDCAPEEFVPKKIVLVGLVNEKLCSISGLLQILDQLVKTVGQNCLPQIEKSCFLVQKSSPQGGESKQEFFLEYVLTMAKKLGLNNLYSTNWNELETVKIFNDTYVVDLNDKNVFVDNHLVHSILSRGARLFKNVPSREINKREHFVQLSAYHGISFQESLSGDCELDLNNRLLLDNNEFIKKFEAVMRSDANIKLPWPYWFADWNKISTSIDTK